ncbi:hypothetical protein [Paracidobacterium acidisoli]|uniref:Uncharacterized protein n=1 Tax=Paracidobacterium acidisoli TaxID=2303751 RepID=A0A372IP55_9BACT|nr:hypothetical protein [Paracidobacterium acidisoli]MBT9330979.1 hypothetical protein [Paracidobacterium acidisoli]
MNSTPQNSTREEQETLRVFWGRFAFSIGLLWGTWNLTSMPVTIAAAGGNLPRPEVFALLVCALSVFPASTLAFWHRRVASLWLVVAGIVTAAGIVATWHQLSTVPGGDISYIANSLAFAFPLALGFFGLTTDLMGWPRLLPRKRPKP